MSSASASERRFDYDLIVIGGGSGGLATSKEAAKLAPGLKIACFDYIKPTPHGTSWGLGGTCVNVGCIPKKLMHYSGLLHMNTEDARVLGWNDLGEGAKHNWKMMQSAIGNLIKALNYGYKSDLQSSKVDYINSYATFVDKNTVAFEKEVKVDGKKVLQSATATAEKFVVACGGRPVYPDDCEGAHLAITSDDIFWMKNDPGKTLVVGASYIALECGGFLKETNHDVTIAVRSILLRGFDRQCADQIGEFMERKGIRFLNPVQIKKIQLKNPDQEIKKVAAGVPNVRGPLIVTLYNTEEKKEYIEEFDTVMYAVGREIPVKSLGLEKAGVEVYKGKIVVNEAEQTSVPNIYALGDAIVCDTKAQDIAYRYINRPELTPVAIQAGRALAKRLYAGSSKLMDYVNVPTAVFTPIEYGACGFSQEEAEYRFGKHNIRVLAVRYGALESACTSHEYVKYKSQVFTGKQAFHRQYELKNGREFNDPANEFEEDEQHKKYMKQPLLAKLIVDTSKQNQVIGFHYVGPNAGEICQGYALALKKGATVEDFDNLVGIHPTCAEEFTVLSADMSKGEDYFKHGGC
jgi:thioredoxin reductase (NADPH)